MTTWTTFWFESNQFFDWVKSPEDWEKVKAAYSQPGSLLSVDLLLDQAREAAPKGAHPKFGIRLECDGDKTLREFFAENGMAA